MVGMANEAGDFDNITAVPEWAQAFGGIRTCSSVTDCFQYVEGDASRLQHACVYVLEFGSSDKYCSCTDFFSGPNCDSVSSWQFVLLNVCNSFVVLCLWSLAAWVMRKLFLFKRRLFPAILFGLMAACIAAISYSLLKGINMHVVRTYIGVKKRERYSDISFSVTVASMTTALVTVTFALLEIRYKTLRIYPPYWLKIIPIAFVSYVFFCSMLILFDEMLMERLKFFVIIVPELASGAGITYVTYTIGQDIHAASGCIDTSSEIGLRLRQAFTRASNCLRQGILFVALLIPLQFFEVAGEANRKTKRMTLTLVSYNVSDALFIAYIASLANFHLGSHRKEASTATISDVRVR
jgi:hypothetical protein